LTDQINRVRIAIGGAGTPPSSSLGREADLPLYFSLLPFFNGKLELQVVIQFIGDEI
jgi:hypothetical protein